MVSLDSTLLMLNVALEAERSKLRVAKVGGEFTVGDDDTASYVIEHRDDESWRLWPATEDRQSTFARWWEFTTLSDAVLYAAQVGEVEFVRNSVQALIREDQRAD